MLLIPAIDLRGGRCVRLYQGDFDAETRYEVEPRTLLDRYRQLGAPWLHVVDLDGARDGTQFNRAAVLELATKARDWQMSLQAGGGVRDAATIETLLSGGVSRVVIGSAAVTRPAEVGEWLRRFGPEVLTIAFDVRLNEDGQPCCAIHGWREQSSVDLWQAIDIYASQGLRHVLCTDISRDGALSGPNLNLYKECVRRYPQIAWQASGGIRHTADMKDLTGTGVAAAISGRALLEQRLAPEELRPFLPNA